MKSLFKCLCLALLLTACSSPPLPVEVKPVRPPAAGIVRQVNRAEHYLVFERLQPLAPGRELRFLRNDRLIGSGRVTTVREEKFQVADILSGSPQVGDFCEPVPALLPRSEP